MGVATILFSPKNSSLKIILDYCHTENELLLPKLKEKKTWATEDINDESLVLQEQRTNK